MINIFQNFVLTWNNSYVVFYLLNLPNISFFVYIFFAVVQRPTRNVQSTAICWSTSLSNATNEYRLILSTGLTVSCLHRKVTHFHGTPCLQLLLWRHNKQQPLTLLQTRIRLRSPLSSLKRSSLSTHGTDRGAELGSSSAKWLHDPVRPLHRNNPRHQRKPQDDNWSKCIAYSLKITQTPSWSAI